MGNQRIGKLISKGSGELKFLHLKGTDRTNMGIFAYFALHAFIKIDFHTPVDTRDAAHGTVRDALTAFEAFFFIDNHYFPPNNM